MPELPEVETIRRGLASHVVGDSIVTVSGDRSRVFRRQQGGAEELAQALTGRTITAVERRGKFMWIVAEGLAEVLVVHLGMSGRIHVSTADALPTGLGPHEHLRWQMSTGAQVHFFDPRTFGSLALSPLVKLGERCVPRAVAHIAPDPRESGWDLSEVVARGSKSSRHIKTLLLDQSLVSGIGNIYADEGLFRALIPGWIRGRDLSDSQWSKVLLGSSDAMGEAIDVGGTSFDSLYVDVDGNPGYFSRSLKIYGREGEACVRCGTAIGRVVLDQRSHFFCPACQRF